MKKIISLIVSFVLFIAICICFVGCDKVEMTNEMFPERFTVIESAEGADGYSAFIYDKYTKVMYLYIRSNSGCTITVLYDENGKPLLYDEAKGGAKNEE